MLCMTRVYACPIAHPCMSLPVCSCLGLCALASLIVDSHSQGHIVRAVDWKENEYMSQDEFCHEFLNLDLRTLDTCLKACEGMDWCFNLAVCNSLAHNNPACIVVPRAHHCRPTLCFWWMCFANFA